MPLPNQANRDLMTNHELNPIKGWFESGSLDKSALADTTDDTIYKGNVMSLDASGHLVLGLTENAMPIFALQNSYDYDVVAPNGNIVGAYNGGAVNEATGLYVADATYTTASRAPTMGVMSGLVATGGYEVESTEFDDEETYTPNMPVTAGAPGDADAGVLKPGTLYTDTICGIVSDVIPAGGIINEHRVAWLRFWTVFVPAFESTGTGTA